jgi:hypothetical protein
MRRKRIIDSKSSRTKSYCKVRTNVKKYKQKRIILRKKVLKANAKDVLRMQGLLSQSQNEETTSEDEKSEEFLIERGYFSGVRGTRAFQCSV